MRERPPYGGRSRHVVVLVVVCGGALGAHSARRHGRGEDPLGALDRLNPGEAVAGTEHAHAQAGWPGAGAEQDAVEPISCKQRAGFLERGPLRPLGLEVRQAERSQRRAAETGRRPAAGSVRTATGRVGDAGRAARRARQARDTTPPTPCRGPAPRTERRAARRAASARRAPGGPATAAHQRAHAGTRPRSSRPRVRSLAWC